MSSEMRTYKKSDRGPRLGRSKGHLKAASEGNELERLGCQMAGIVGEKEDIRRKIKADAYFLISRLKN